jgi:ribonucleoside-diphosphate reductase alpha chain
MNNKHIAKGPTMQQKLFEECEQPKIKVPVTNTKTDITTTKIDTTAGQQEMHPETNYNFKRLSQKGEKCWNDVVKRFTKELKTRGCKTPIEDIEWLCLNYHALPNSPALLTAGMKNFYASACSSYPIKDTMDEVPFSILDTLKISSMATKAGIGTGFNFSHLRSKEEPERGRTNVTGGPISFIRAYSGFFREITQATRKSASMGLLHVNHPDIIDYINCKAVDGQLEGFNLTTIIDDKFMKAVEENSDYELIYINKDKDGNKTKKVKARDIFEVMCQRIWDNGEPGVMFEDTIKKDYFEDEINILANPCSEALLSHGDDWLELCVLSSIDLPKYMALNT